ncbi:MAG: ribosome-associated translation inhibitor RaiA [Planctomycetota bacterium]
MNQTPAKGDAMEITLTGKHMDITEAIEQHANEKAGKLSRYYDRLAKLEIVINKASDGRAYDVEFIAHVDGQDHLIAHATDEDLYHGIEQTVQKMERQLTDLKEKLRSHKY